MERTERLEAAPLSHQTPHPRQRELAAVCRKHRLGLVYLFGSGADSGARILAGEADVRPRDALSDLDLGMVTLDALPGG
jgi:predicted nucleotidyltransferase